MELGRTADPGAKTNHNLRGIGNSNLMECEAGPFLYHPHMQLLENFEPPEHQLVKSPENPPLSISKTPLYSVSTKDELEGLAVFLNGLTEIAVNCTFSTQKYEDELLLLGISTSTADYAIDVQMTGMENLRRLQPFFANPNVVKVFVASKVCIYFLQQTLDLFLVNVFDLTSAAQKLGETLDMAAKLKQSYGVFLKVDPKKFTGATRPLPDDVKIHCRYSTHYSLHIYHQLKNRLLDRSIADYKAFLRICNAACRIKHEAGKERNFMELKKRIEMMQRGQLVVLEKLHQWRVEVGRIIDKSPGDVLNTSRLKLMAIEMPESKEDILEVARSPHVEKDIETVSRIMKEAIEKYGRLDPAEIVDQRNIAAVADAVKASTQQQAPALPVVRPNNNKRKLPTGGKNSFATFNQQWRRKKK